ncbi:hypothetical protein F4778DRAFT_748132 [Xylariomycetidae sp. FL2044]|nr:hypothetical protein F4778DRAFT_748132 [Xylariomycetidae sp. FL2044]
MTPTVVSSSVRLSVGNWSFADPYAYQYADIHAQDSPDVDATSNAPCQLGGKQSIEPLIHELAASLERATLAPPRASIIPGGPVELDANAQNLQRQPSSLTLSRSRCTNGRGSVRNPHHHRRVASMNHPVRAMAPHVVQAAGHGLIPVLEEAPSTATYSAPSSPTGERWRPRLSPQKCEGGGLISAEELVPQTSIQDFDSILASMDSRKKGVTGPSRSSRRYDKFSGNN